jgi:menaquinone-dependent protoporphyrinogen oxidase
MSLGMDVPDARRVLVVYASRTGSTAEIAQVMGATLAMRGWRTDVVSVCDRPLVTGYDAVVLGSAVHGGKWLPEAIAFIEENVAALRRVPVAVFTVHGMNLGSDAERVAARRAYLDLVRTRIAPIDEVWFAGVVPQPVKSNFLALWMYRAAGGGCEGDCRDWSAIRAWAEQVHRERAGREEGQNRNSATAHIPETAKSTSVA